MYRASVDSRFPDFGKVILLSFPRYKNDYIQERYNAVVADVETVVRDYKFKMEKTFQTGRKEMNLRFSGKKTTSFHIKFLGSTP